MCKEGIPISRRLCKKELFLFSILFFLLNISTACAKDWEVIYDKPWIGIYYLDKDSVVHEDALSKKEKVVVISTVTRMEFSAFGAGVYAGFMQGMQKDRKDFLPGVDFSKLKEMKFTCYFDIKNYRIASGNAQYYDIDGKVIAKTPSSPLKWTKIKKDSDDDTLVKAALATMAEKIWQNRK